MSKSYFLGNAISWFLCRNLSYLSATVTFSNCMTNFQRRRKNLPVYLFYSIENVTFMYSNTGQINQPILNPRV